MELKILLDEVESHKNYYLVNIEWSWQTILKKRVWEGICEKVNSVSTGHSRTVEELSKKWSTNASDTKKISSNRRVALKTGGGSFPPELIPLQDKIVGAIAPASVEWIYGGLDTCLDTCGENNNAFRDPFPNFTSYMYNSCKVKHFFITLI